MSSLSSAANVLLHLTDGLYLQLNIDSGAVRLGFPENELREIIDKALSSAGLKVFSNPDESVRPEKLPSLSSILEVQAIAFPCANPEYMQWKSEVKVWQWMYHITPGLPRYFYPTRHAFDFGIDPVSEMRDVGQKTYLLVAQIFSELCKANDELKDCLSKNSVRRPFSEAWRNFRWK